jgi:hypothetical protein
MLGIPTEICDRTKPAYNSGLQIPEHMPLMDQCGREIRQDTKLTHEH